MGQVEAVMPSGSGMSWNWGPIGRLACSDRRSVIPSDREDGVGEVQGTTQQGLRVHTTERSVGEPLRVQQVVVGHTRLRRQGSDSQLIAQV